VSRVLLGLGTSGCYPAAMVLVRQRSDRAGVAVPGPILGALSIAGQVSAAIGLPLGGLLVAGFGWRSTFAINVPLAVLTLALAVTGIRPDSRSAHRTRVRVLASRLDLIGAALFCASMSGWFQTLQGIGSGFSPGLLAVTLLGTGIFVAWERVAAAPLVDIRGLTANRAPAMTYCRSAGAFVVIYGFMYGITQWLQEARHLSSSHAALVLLPMSLVSALVSVPSARTTRLRRSLVVSSGVYILALVGLLLTGESTPLIAVVGVAVAFGVAIGLSVIANQAALYWQAAPDQIGAASGLMRCANYVGAVISSAVITVTFGRYGAGRGAHGARRRDAGRCPSRPISFPRVS
jgi:predicted MFS family arabinose efflux permease